MPVPWLRLVLVQYHYTDKLRMFDCPLKRQVLLLLSMVVEWVMEPHSQDLEGTMTNVGTVCIYNPTCPSSILLHLTVQISSEGYFHETRNDFAFHNLAEQVGTHQSLETEVL